MNPHQEWAHTVVDALVERGYERDSISIEPSNVTLSPHEYVYVFFTEDRFDGRHAILSQDAEYESDSTGVLVGVYDSVTTFDSGEDGAPELADDVYEAIGVMERLR